MSAAKTVIPFLDIRPSQAELETSIVEAWTRVLQSTEFIGGPEVDKFESELAASVGVEHCVSLANGTDALHLVYLAQGVGPGDEVVVPAQTFIATAAPVIHCGARPVLVDVDRATGTMDPNRLTAAITPRTKMIVPVHLYGQPAEMDSILEIGRRHGVAVLEDTAQAQGAEYRSIPVGRFGAAATFSFYPGKNLGACGDAGAVVTDDGDLARAVRILANHGQPQKYVHDIVGFNSRLDAIQAAVLRVKLPHLPRWNDERRTVAAAYHQRLATSGLELPLEQEQRKHIYHLYVARHPRRDEIVERLSQAEISCGMHYPTPLHLHQAFADLGYEPGSFPEAERWAGQGFSLPIFPGITTAQVDRVCEALLEMRLEPFDAD